MIARGSLAAALVLMILSTLVVAVPAGAAPTNDDLDSATLITDDYEATTHNTGATLEGGEIVGSCEYTTPDWSIWYRFSAPGSGAVRVATRFTPTPNETNYIEAFEITSFGPTTLGSEVDCVAGQNSATSSFAVTAGDYAIRIAGEASDLGDDIWLEFDTMGGLSGTVIDADTTLGINNITIEVLDLTGGKLKASTSTTTDGTWSVAVPTESVLVRFSDPGAVYGTVYYDNVVSKVDATSIVVTTNTNTPGIDAALSSAGSLSGTVTTSLGGPLDNGTISFYAEPSGSLGPPLYQVTTDVDGTYSRTGVAPGNYVARFDHVDHLAEWYQDAVFWDTATTIVVTAGLTTVTDVELLAGGEISGVVTDELSNPLAGVMVELYRAEGDLAYNDTTAADGSYSIKGTEADTYAVRANTDSLAGAYGSGWFDGFADSTAYSLVEKITVTAGSSDTADFALPISKVSGTVTDFDDTLPIEGINIELHDDTTTVASTTTAPDGTYSMSAFGFSGTDLEVVFLSSGLNYQETSSGPFAFTAGDHAVTNQAMPIAQVAPQIDPNQSFEVVENVSTGTAVGKVAAADANRADSLSFSITGGNAGSAFAINPTTGSITTAGPIDHESKPSFTLTITVDDSNTPSVGEVLINVTDVNESPSAPDTDGTVAEDASAGTLVATVVATDPDGDAITYAITAGNGDGAFAIDGSGAITVTGPLDYETQTAYNLTVQAVDPDGLSDQATVSITVTDVNEPPSAPDTDGTVAEDASAGTLVATVVATDPEGGAVTYAITAGNGDGAFAIDGSGAITVTGPLDYETQTAYNLTVQAVDPDGLSDQATVSITVTDVIEVIPSGGFIDTVGSVFEEDIDWLAWKGITKGCNPPDNNLFCPDNPVTRGQMAAFLVRALSLPNTSIDFFEDDDGSIFEADINKLAAAGITKGCNPPSNNLFCPNGTVTRGQMAAFLVRALGLTDDGNGNLFLDDDASIFEADIDKLGTAGVTKGCNPPDNNLFCPDNPVTRGQMAAFLRRALEGTL